MLKSKNYILSNRSILESQKSTTQPIQITLQRLKYPKFQQQVSQRSIKIMQKCGIYTILNNKLPHNTQLNTSKQKSLNQNLEISNKIQTIKKQQKQSPIAHKKRSGCIVKQKNVFKQNFNNVIKNRKMELETELSKSRFMHSQKSSRIIQSNYSPNYKNYHYSQIKNQKQKKYNDNNYTYIDRHQNQSIKLQNLKQKCNNSQMIDLNASKKNQNNIFNINSPTARLQNKKTATFPNYRKSPLEQKYLNNQNLVPKSSNNLLKQYELNSKYKKNDRITSLNDIQKRIKTIMQNGMMLKKKSNYDIEMSKSMIGTKDK